MQVSYSGLATFNSCQKKRGLKLSGARPAFRPSYFLLGGVGHEVIRQLHDDPRAIDVGIPTLIEDEINIQIMRQEDTPVHWGKGDPGVKRQEGTDKLIETVEAYWSHNYSVNLVSSERNFWVPFSHPALGDEPVILNGRFDQLRMNLREQIEVWELKTSKTSSVKFDGDPEYDDDEYLLNPYKAGDLERDDQCIMQAFGFAFGYVAMQHMDYVSEGSDRYHEHDFVETSEPNIFTCKHCPQEYRFQKFNMGWPARIVRYLPYGHIPLKTGKRAGLERFPTRYEISWDEELLTNWTEIFAAKIYAYQQAIKSGCFLPTGQSGFAGSCSDCEFASQCSTKVAHIKVRK